MPRWIKHYFSDKEFVELTSDEVKTLAVEAANGSREAAERLIIGHIRIAFGVVSRLDGNTDELMSEAIFSLVNAVRLISEGRLTNYENVSAYIKKHVGRDTIKFIIRQRSVVRQPPEAVVPDVPLKDDVSVSFNNTLEVEEQIDFLANDDTDAKIIRLLLLGNSADEIAKITGLHRSRIFRRINRIREAYQHECD